MEKQLQILPIALVTLALALAMPATASAAAVLYNTAGSSYTQNFDSLASSGDNPWTNGGTLTGWHAVQTVGATTTDFTSYIATADAGASATDELRSLGNSSDRALGAQNGNDAQNIHYGLQLSNNTGFTLDSFTLTYTGEQWRMISGEGADGLTFSYQIFNSGTGSLTAATPWTDVADLNFTAPRTTGGSSTGLDGNLANNRVEGITDTLTGLTWADGQELWLRWTDNNPGSSDFKRAAMGIDDLSFTAVPEPTASLLIGIGAFLLGLRRRR